MVTHKTSSGLPVVTLSEGAIVGKLDDFQFDLRTRRIYGFRVRSSGVWSKYGGVEASKLERIGKDVVFVTSEAEVEWRAGGTRHAEEGRAWASQYRGIRVMSRSGAAVGAVDDLIFDASANRVLGLILDNGQSVILDEHVATGPAAVILETTEQLQQTVAEEPAAEGEAWWTRLTSRRGPEATEEVEPSE